MNAKGKNKDVSEGITRRNFMKTAGATAGVAVATGYSPFSYAANEKVRVASIGTGGMGSQHLRDGLGRAHNIKIVAVCDVYIPHLAGGYKNAGGGDVKMYMDYREMLDKEELDAVVIATPLHTHYAITMDCLDAGKYCFTEKTMCHEIECCRDVVIKAREVGRFVQVGHQRRYNPTYNHAIKLAHDEGVLGRINHIDAQWHRNNAWRRPVSKRPLTAEEKKYIKDLERHINWRLYNESSGGLMTELATHQLDIANWFLDAMPTRVFGYGGIDYWRDGRDVFDNVNLVYEYEITPENRGFREIEPRIEAQRDYGRCNEPYKVRVCYSSICGNAVKGATELIQGDQGSFELTELGSLFYTEAYSKVKWADKAQRDEASENAIIITSGGTLSLSNQKRKDAKPVVVETDKTVDQIQMEAFARDIQEGGTPKANVMVGLRTAVCGLAGLKALREQCEVTIDPAWYTFDFDTPDPSMYG